jgi:HK97 family phage major capsid protein
MVKMNNRTILQKADLALADLVTGGGVLKPVAAKKFIRLLIKQSELLKMVTAVPMAAPQQSFPKIKFSSRVLQPEPASGPLTPAQRVKPDIDSVELSAKAFKAEVRLPDQVLEDNVEEGQLRQTIMELLADAVSRDMEDVCINGDTTSVDPVLAQLDGALKQAVSHVVDAGGTPLSKEFLTDLMKSLPSEYAKLRKEMRYFTSVDAELDYRKTLADRETGAGDKYLETDAPIVVSGVPLMPIALFPETLGATGDQTVTLLTHPKNVYVGIWREIKIETARDISEGATIIVARLRFDVKFADELGVAKGINVQL